MIKAIVVVYLTLCGRLHGGGLATGVNRHARNAIWAIPYVFCGPTWWLQFATAFIGINAGHDEFWKMGTAPNDPKNNWLTWIVRKTRFKRDSVAWCMTGMAIKGAIIGAGTFNPYIILGHAALLPAAYYIGQRTKWENEAAEYLTGFFLGLNLIAVYSF